MSLQQKRMKAGKDEFNFMEKKLKFRGGRKQKLKYGWKNGRKIQNPWLHMSGVWLMGLLIVVVGWALGFLACLFGVQFLDPDLGWVTAFFGPSLIVLIFILAFCAAADRPVFKDFFHGLKGNTPSDFAKGMLLGFFLNAICLIPGLLGSEVTLDPKTPSLLLYGRAGIAFGLVFIQACAMELVFRGYMFLNGRNRVPDWVNFTVSSILFAAVHLLDPDISWIGLLNYTAAGMLLATCVHFFDSLWMAIGLHAAWHFTSIIIFGLPTAGIQSSLSIWTLQNTAGSFFYNNHSGLNGTPFAVLVICSMIGLMFFMGWCRKKDL